MGCCTSRKSLDFARVNNKRELIKLYEGEIKRLDLLNHTLVIDEKNPLDLVKKHILNKILLEHNKLLVYIVKSCEEDHIKTIKFIFEDYFHCTETWDESQLEEEFENLQNFFSENKLNVDNSRNYG
jgi:hypothetical protein